MCHMTMIKTYRRDADGVLHYREAWSEAGGVRTHEGKVGTKGSTRFHSSRSRNWPNNPTATEFLRSFVETAAADGYHPIDLNDHAMAVLQIVLSSPDLSDPDDARLFEHAEDVLNEVLGWRGVGHCDGNDVGSNSAPGASQPVLNLYCPVVDEAAGVSAVRRAARDLGIEQPYRVGVRAPGEHTDYQLAWSPTRRDKSFSL